MNRNNLNKHVFKENVSKPKIEYDEINPILPVGTI